MNCPKCKTQMIIGSHKIDKEKATESFQFICPKCEPVDNA